jgi:hypothetical protein
MRFVHLERRASHEGMVGVGISTAWRMPHASALPRDKTRGVCLCHRRMR